MLNNKTKKPLNVSKTPTKCKNMCCSKTKNDVESNIDILDALNNHLLRAERMDVKMLDQQNPSQTEK